MTDPAADAARAAAAILAPDLGPSLPAEVEAALAARDTAAAPRPLPRPGLPRQPDRGHRHPRLDHLQRPARPHTTQTRRADSIARQVRITLREQDTTLPPGTERITEIVATEITRHAQPAPVAGPAPASLPGRRETPRTGLPAPHPAPACPRTGPSPSLPQSQFQSHSPASSSVRQASSRSCGRGHRRSRLGERTAADLESVLGATPRGFESRVLRSADQALCRAIGRGSAVLLRV